MMNEIFNEANAAWFAAIGTLLTACFSALSYIAFKAGCISNQVDLMIDIFKKHDGSIEDHERRIRNLEDED